VQQCLAAQTPDAVRIEPTPAPKPDDQVDVVVAKANPWPLIVGILFAVAAGFFAYRRWKK
jgi:LPXTG-motif cell wall-anchored protein